MFKISDGSIKIDTKIDETGIDKGISSMQSKLEKVGSKLTSAGSLLTKTLTLPILAAGGASVKFAIDQETAFAKVSTLLTGSSEDYDKYKTDIRKASSEMGVSFGEYSEAVYGSISAGVAQGEAIEFTARAAKLAKGGFTDTATAVDIMTTAINAYGLEASDAGKISDMLINTQNMGKTTVDELSSSMGAVIPVAQAQGVSFDQLATGYAVLTKNGIATSEAGTYMKSMFGELGKSGSKVDKILREKTGKSFSELQAEGMNTGDVLGILSEEAEASGLKLSDMFGSAEAGSAALVLAKDGGAEFNDILGTMETSAGATDEAFNKMNDTTGEKMAKAFIKMQNAGATLGDVLLPIIAKIAEAIAKLAEKFTGLSPTMKKVVLIVGAVLAAVGPLLVMIGSVISAIGIIIPLFAGLSIPLWPVIAIFGLLVAAGVALYKNWDTVKAKAVEVFNSFSPLMEVVKEAFQSLKNSIQPIIETLKNIFQSLLPILKLIGAVVGGVIVVAFGIAIAIFSAVVAAIGPLVNAFLNIVDVIINVVNTVIALLTGDFTGAMDYWTAAVDASIQFFVSMWQSLVGFFSTLVKTIIAFFANLYDVLVGHSIIPDLVEAIVQWFTNMGKWLVDLVKAMVTNVITFFTNLKDKVVGIFNVLKSVIETVWNSIKSFFTTVITAIVNFVIQRFENLKNNVTTLFNAVKTIATNVWNAIKLAVSTAVDSIKSKVTAVFNAVKSSVTTILNSIKSTFVNIWNAIKTTISTAINGIKTTISNGITSALNIVTNMGAKFKAAGSKLISMMADGIKNAVGKVTGAISNVVSKVRDFLPFSPAKVGPLSDLNKLDFEGPITDSIDGGKIKVQSAMEHMLSGDDRGAMQFMPDFSGQPALAETPNSSIKTPLNKSDRELSSEGVYQFDITIPIDGETIAKKTVRFTARELERMRVGKIRAGGYA